MNLTLVTVPAPFRRDCEIPAFDREHARMRARACAHACQPARMRSREAFCLKKINFLEKGKRAERDSQAMASGVFRLTLRGVLD